MFVFIRTADRRRQTALEDRVRVRQTCSLSVISSSGLSRLFGLFRLFGSFTIPLINPRCLLPTPYSLLSASTLSLDISEKLALRRSNIFFSTIQAFTPPLTQNWIFLGSWAGSGCRKNIIRAQSSFFRSSRDLSIWTLPFELLHLKFCLPPPTSNLLRLSDCSTNCFPLDTGQFLMVRGNPDYW